MRGVLAFSALISVVAFPFPYTIALVLVGSFFEPLLPLAIGLLADVLYYAPGMAIYPRYTIYGALLTGLVIFVRKQLRAGIIG